MFGTTLDARGLRNPKALQVSLIVSRFPANPRRKVTTSFSVAVLCKDINETSSRAKERKLCEECDESREVILCVFL